MDNKSVAKLLETVAFSNGCICSVELIRREHTHFHPSGRLEPSKEDTIMTDRILKLSCLLGIPLDDHVIVGGDNSRYFSFREKEIMTMPKISLTQDYHYLEFEERALVAEPGRSR